MDSNKNIGIGGALVIAIVAGLLAGGLAAWLVKPKVAAVPADGFVGAAPGNLLAEDYDPYVQYNGGYNSAKSITTADALKGATIEATGASTLTGAVSMGSTLSVTGATTLSSTLSVTSTTSAASLVIGSTTPASLNGNVLLIDNRTANATTTIYASSINGTKGACIQLEGPASTTFAFYATTSGPLIGLSGTTCQ